MWVCQCDRYSFLLPPHHNPTLPSFPVRSMSMAQEGWKLFNVSCDVCRETMEMAGDGGTMVDGVRCGAPRCSCVMHHGCVLGADLFGPHAKAVEDAVNDFLRKKRKKTDAASFYCRCVTCG